MLPGRFLVQSARGSLLVEALVGMAILSVALLPIFAGFMTGPAAQRQAGQHLAALNIARARLESLHTLTPREWDGLTPTGPTPDPAQPEYDVALAVAPRPDLSGLKDVTVTVAWVDGRGNRSAVSLATAVARRP